MLKIRRANSILYIEPDALDYYLTSGYSVVDEKNNVIRQAIPVTKEELHRAYIENTETIKKLNATIAELQEKLAAVDTPTKTRAASKKKQ